MNKTCTGLSALLAITLPLSAIGGGGDETSDLKKKKALRLNEDLVLDVLSTSPLTGPMLRQAFPWIGPQLEARWHPELEYSPYTELFEQFEVEKRLSPDALLEGLREICGVDGSVAGSNVEVVGNNLILVHKQAVIDKMKAVYQQILQNTAPKLRFEYLFFDAAPDAQGVTPGTMDSKAAGALLRKANAGELGRVLLRGNASVRTGDSIRVGRRRSQKIVGDIDVEIAQESEAGDPVMVELDLGLGLSLRPILAPDGAHFALFGMFNSRELHGGVQSESVVAKGLKSIDQVRIDYRQNAFSLLLADGGACLLAPGGSSQPSLRVLIQVRRTQPRMQDPAGVAIVPTGLISTRALQPKKPRDGVPAWLAPRGLSVGFVTESMHQLLTEVDDQTNVQNYPEFLMIKSKAAEQGRKILHRFSRDLVRNFVVEVRREVQPLEDPRAPWSTHGEAIRFPLMGSRLGYAMNGYEQTYTADYEVEVAQKANIGDPKQRACFVGFRGWAAVVPAGDRSLVHLDLRDSSLQEWRRVPAPSTVVGDISTPTIEEVHVLQQLSMAQGESRSLGEGARREIHGVPHRTRLSVKLIER